MMSYAADIVAIVFRFELVISTFDVVLCTRLRFPDPELAKKPSMSRGS